MKMKPAGSLVSGFRGGRELPRANLTISVSAVQQSETLSSQFAEV